MKPSLVLDCSVTMAWCFPDESAPDAAKILSNLRQGAAIVPAIWPLEVANVLLIAERKKRIDYAGMQRALEILEAINIEVDSLAIQKHWTRLLSIGRDQHLSAYDASYLDLAIRSGLPLATLDKDLIRAGGKLGVAIYQPTGF